MEKGIDPKTLPFHIENVVGEILYAENLCPGVYYISAKLHDHRIGSEYYVVETSSPAISKEAKAYGKQIPGFPQILLYTLSYDETSGYKILDYEMRRYKLLHNLSLGNDTTLLETALYAMEYHPEYFGTYPVPLITPKGRTIRHKTIMNGVYWIETDTCKEVLALCYPIWSNDLSKGVIRLSEQIPTSWQGNIPDPFAYRFFSKRTSCLALFELVNLYKELRDSNCINYLALMNCIWKYHPLYAVAYNVQNQIGLCDCTSLLIHTLGKYMVLRTEPDRLITITKGAGLDIFNFTDS